MCATPSESIQCLDPYHQNIFRKALTNLLSTDLAEHAFAQILDGLPTEQSATDSWWLPPGHPVLALDHTEICPGFLEKARHFRDRFDPSELQFDPSLLAAFQKATSGSREFNLRLVWLVVVACHQIAAFLYELDDGAHQHQVYARWADYALSQGINGGDSLGYAILPSAFSHRAYVFPEQYPKGLADVAGYWAEGKIFGGVIVFDRGETEQECKSMWIHGAGLDEPQTLFPPKPEEFETLINFLLSEAGDDAPCPLPFHGTVEHIPRWDPYQAIARYHIFRDKYERPIPTEPPRARCVRSGFDWPELTDQVFLLNQAYAERKGEPVDEKEIAAAKARLREVTPSSPCWFPPRE